MPAPVPAFDTLKYADALRATGVPDAQARATVQMVADAFEINMDRLATKDDLKLLGVEIRGEMKQLASQLGHVKWMSGPVALVALIWITKEALKVFGVVG
jgi:hypothetical protein